MDYVPKRSARATRSDTRWNADEGASTTEAASDEADFETTVMRENLRQLRAFSFSSKRKRLAIRLAQTKPSVELVKELIRMVEGRVRFVGGTWVTLWLNIPIPYSYRDQLTGIEALGKTGRMDALNYLKKLSGGLPSERYVYGNRCDPYTFDDVYRYSIDYPNAKRRLRRAMRTESEVHTAAGSQEDTIKYDSNVHDLIAEAVNTIELALNSSYDQAANEARD